MSSLYTRNKEYTRSKKSQSDSPPSSPSPIAKTFRHERLSRLDSASSSTGTSDTYGDRPSGRSSAYTRRAALSNRTEDDSSKDYKKLYESALSENQKLKSKLQDAQSELTDVKSKMDKLTQQKQEKTSDRSSMLEIEKRVLTDLKSDNQRLKDENGALIRVISKLSK
uniref:Protein phosphatase 1 regulatory subunit 12B n=1 Tax=Pseudonaja textilis TaxID=8673 RepID=A0A670YGF2_PSETE